MNKAKLFQEENKMQLFVYPLQLQAAIFPGSYGKSSKGVLCVIPSCNLL
jgi:hypothetical protein